MIRMVGLALLMAGTAAPSLAAPLGKRYTSYVSMHRSTDYGSLFLNEGSVRIEHSRKRKRFLTVTDSGDVAMPRQTGYCFLFNHYDSPDGNDTTKRTYRAKIKKQFANGTEAVDSFEGSFIPTKKLWSSDAPDLCVRGIRGVSKVAIEFTSDDGKYFEWNISFATK